jgi:hypothetical protein
MYDADYLKSFLRTGQWAVLMESLRYEYGKAPSEFLTSFPDIYFCGIIEIISSRSINRQEVVSRKW